MVAAVSGSRPIRCRLWRIALSGETALLIGCAPDNAGTVVSYLTSKGVKVQQADADREAFRMCMTNRFSLVIVDFTAAPQKAALVIESITLVTPDVSIAAIEPKDGLEKEAVTKVALGKSRVRIRQPISDEKLGVFLPSFA